MEVSILVPIYGVEKYIERCSVSLFEQTYHDIEYVFINDCTTDQSITILKSVIERYPSRKSRVKIIEHEKNKGLGAARNTGVRHASGEFIIHVDSDDYIDKSFVEKCVKKQLETNADIVSVDILRLCKNKNITHKHLRDVNTPKELNIAICKHTIPNNVWGRMIRRSLYIDNNIEVTTGVNMTEDLNVLPRLVYYSKTIAFIDEVLHFYDCTNTASYTASFSEKNASQRRITASVLYDFFMEKDPEIIEALNQRFYFDLVNDLINSVKEPGHESFYYQTRLLVDEYPIAYQGNLPIAKKLAVYIKNRVVFTMYVKAATLIKHLFDR